jgi:uncharacterized protein (DUF697 family)
LPRLSQFRLLTFHSALFGLSTTMAGGFIGAFLLKLGLGLPVALASYAALLLMRFAMRFMAIAVVRRVGMRGGLRIGAVAAACAFLPLMLAEERAWLVAWVLLMSAAEALYWPVYHASTAASVQGSGAFGRQVAERTTVGALVSVIGPLTGGLIFSTWGEATGFALAALVCVLSTLPVGAMAPIDAGPVPRVADSLQGDSTSMATFAADGWIASGLGYAWPMVLYVSMGGSWEAFGATNALAGLVGAGASLVCGRAVDRGQRDRYLAVVCIALLAAFVLRAASAWSPLAALLASASGAAVAGFYGPVVMSLVYERSKRSGSAYRNHLAAEAAWDMGAIAGLLAAAIVAATAPVLSFAVLPAALGVAALYVFVRGSSRLPRAASLAG